MGKTNSVGSVDVEWLSFSISRRASGWISHCFFFLVTGRPFGCGGGVLTMTYSHIPRKVCQVLLSSDNLGAETVALPGIYLASLSARCDSTGILSAVLEDWEPVADVLDGRSSGVCEDDGDDSTHSEIWPSSFPGKARSAGRRSWGGRGKGDASLLFQA